VIVSGMPSITITPTAAAVSAPLMLGFNVNTTDYNNDTTSAFVLVVDAAMALDLTIVNHTAGGNVTYAIAGSLGYVTANISVGSTNVGAVNAGLLQGCVSVCA